MDGCMRVWRGVGIIKNPEFTQQLKSMGFTTGGLDPQHKGNIGNYMEFWGGHGVKSLFSTCCGKKTVI